MRANTCLGAVVAILLLVPALADGSKAVNFQKGDGRIDVLIGGRPFTSYYFSPDLPRPFFHPLRSAEGIVVTRGYPMIPDVLAEAKDRDHPHHRSFWFTFGDVDGVDYWGENSKIPGKIVHRSVDKIVGGASQGVLKLTMDWIDNTGRKVLVQNEEIIFHGDETRRYMDLTIQVAPTDHDVRFNDTKEGMFAVRVATPLKEPNGGVITNSRGAAGEKNCWGKPAEWVDYSGQLEGAKVGVTIMDHPNSFRHPTTWHVRAYGLFAANPFGLRDFTGDKAADGSHRLEPGKHLVLRYRVLVHPGSTAEANIAAEYQRYLQEVK